MWCMLRFQITLATAAAIATGTDVVLGSNIVTAALPPSAVLNEPLSPWPSVQHSDEYTVEFQKRVESEYEHVSGHTDGEAGIIYSMYIYM